MTQTRNSEHGRRSIVILGAGFGGITALKKLYRALRERGLLAKFELILVSNRPYHLYTPALYEIAAIPKGEADAVCLKSASCIAIEDIIAPLSGVRFIGGAVAGLDPRQKTMRLESGEVIGFDYAVVALGAETNFFGIPGLEEHSFPLKTFEDAVRLRNRVEELAGRTTGTLRIVIGGGGATGVELAAEFINYLCYLEKHVAAGRCRAEVTIVEAGPEILSGFPPSVVRRARKRLRRLGIKIMTGARIARVGLDQVMLEGGLELPYQLLVWSGGVMAPRAIKTFGLNLDRRGGIMVNEYLESTPGIYAIGDNASFIHPGTGRTLPGTVPVAEAQARVAARNVIAGITGTRPHRFRPLQRYPFILAVGGKYALTDLVIAKFFGFLGWALKQLVELRYLFFILPWPKAIRTWWRTVYYSTRND